MSAEVAAPLGSVVELSADSARELTDQIRTAVGTSWSRRSAHDPHPWCPSTPILPARPDRAGCYRTAGRAVWGLRAHGVHELSLALLVARLDGAWDAELHAARGTARPAPRCSTRWPS